MKIELRQAHALDLATLHARLRRRFEHYADRLAPLPLRDSVRFEERAVRGRFRGTDGVLTQGVTPTLRLTGGAELGFNAGWWWGALHANAGYSVVGAAVLQGTTSLATTRGFTAGGGLSVGVRW